jgi:hypothetical protein
VQLSILNGTLRNIRKSADRALTPSPISSPAAPTKDATPTDSSRPPIIAIATWAPRNQLAPRNRRLIPSFITSHQVGSKPLILTRSSIPIGI